MEQLSRKISHEKLIREIITIRRPDVRVRVTVVHCTKLILWEISTLADISYERFRVEFPRLKIDGAYFIWILTAAYVSNADWLVEWKGNS